MKIEKLNDNQIRCTLTRADLADRQLKLSALVCGTEKAEEYRVPAKMPRVAEKLALSSSLPFD